jgi:hypothetical protein
MIKKLFFLALLCLVTFKTLLATSGVATVSGNWNSTSTWMFNGVHRLPTCGDTVTIPANKTVTVNAQVSYTGCGSTLFITVSGILSFTNGNKLDLPCFSTVDITPGGLVQKATAGGGNSTLISICGTVEWSAGDGPLPGPAILGGGSPLPVKLLSFDAVFQTDHVVISWATASETDNDYFELEHSTDGKTYTQISRLTGYGSSNSLHTYSVTDQDFSNGLNYYRLSQVDINGINHTYPDISYH